MTIVEQLRSRTTPLTVAETAALLGIHRVTAFKMVKNAKLPSFRVGAAVRIDPSELADWIERRSTKAA